MTSLSQLIEQLPDESRVSVKLRAKSLKDRLLDLHPDLTQHPFDDSLNKVCQAAAFNEFDLGSSNDGELLLYAAEMFDGLSDNADSAIFRTDNDDEVGELQKHQQGYQALADQCRSLQIQEVKLSESTEDNFKP